MKMGFIWRRVDRSDLKAGDHIYTYRAAFIYSHHGIFVGGNEVVYFTFTPDKEKSWSIKTFVGSMSKIPPPCRAYPECGLRKAKGGVVASCLDCFLKNGALYRFEYGVSPTMFTLTVRGGTCTTAASDSGDTVVHRAMSLLQNENGFGKYNLFGNNCEDFALYCKTGLVPMNKSGIGRSGQVLSLMDGLAPWVTADIGVRKDVVKIAVEDLVDQLNEEASVSDS